MLDGVTAEPAAETFVWVRGEATSEQDGEVPGVYLVMVDPSVSEEVRVDAALSAFHNSIGIEELDDFEIFVTDAEGVRLSAPENEIDGAIDHADFMGSIAREDWPNAGEPIEPKAPNV